jgi:hypothetical protein
MGINGGRNLFTVENQGHGQLMYGCDPSVLYNKDVASILIIRGHKYQSPSNSNDPTQVTIPRRISLNK